MCVSRRCYSIVRLLVHVVGSRCFYLVCAGVCLVVSCCMFYEEFLLKFGLKMMHHVPRVVLCSVLIALCLWCAA